MTEQQPPQWQPAPGPPQQWQPPQRPSVSPIFPHEEPTPYHLMLRTRTYAPWKPVVGMLVAGAAFLVVSALVYVVVAGIFAFFQSGSWIDNFIDSADLSHVGPETLLGLNLGIGAMILVTWFIVRVVHGIRPRWLTSVVPRMRWNFFVACLGPGLRRAAGADRRRHPAAERQRG